ncbi:uncharacterized protein LOC110840042 isoform X3 [Zootermopsis nevadensis]|uniref:uncharacterized protein LOC110840042 isoform X3 n=1 Tax=Zootermopsis nevadensis TaxID=136037 RepID=UPI000B8E54DD|nr:uncharacterized protein LOC110840042 isoform X3 [Zootermopsis nevadensis]
MWKMLRHLLTILLEPFWGLPSFKATGVILLLGVGSLVCYKICNHYWPRSRPPSSPHPRRHPKGTFVVSRAQDAEDQLLENLDDEELSEVEGHYFGPSPVPQEGEHPKVSNCFPCSRSASGSIYPNSSTSQSDSGTSGEDEGRDADVSDGSQGEMSPKHLHVLHQHQKRHLHRCGDTTLQSKSLSSDTSTKGFVRQPPDKDSGWLFGKIRRILTSTPGRLQLSGSARLNLTPSQSKAVRLHCAETKRFGSELGQDWREDFYLSRARRLAPEGAETETEQEHHSFVRDCNGISLTQNLPSSTSLIRDESYDSLGFSKRLPRDGSFDSTFSEFSVDFLPESSVDVDTGTMICLEKLQQEIDQLKTNCQMMDEEFETIKCNRNLPGMSSLMKANASDSNFGSSALDSNLDEESGHQESKQEKARACFAGLYSLTTIKNSTSSELSDSFPAPVQGLDGQGSIGSAESLVWDSPKLAASPAKKSQVNALHIKSPVLQMSVSV